MKRTDEGQSLFEQISRDLQPHLNVAALVVSERRRHYALGYDDQHDDQHTEGELRHCAFLILRLIDTPPLEMEDLGAYRQRVRSFVYLRDARKANWMWQRATAVVHKYDELQALVVAQALLMAESERLLRAGARERAGA